MVWEFPAVSHTRYDFWKAKQFTQSGMWWFTLLFGIFGLHHYMLRSPQTGMIFFLTNFFLCGYPLMYDLVQLSSYCNTTEELNEFGLSHPWGALGLAQGMWRKDDEKEVTDADEASLPILTAALAAATAAASASVPLPLPSQAGGGEEAPAPVPEEKPKCVKDDYSAPSPLLFILYNLCVPISPLAHLIGGNRERALTRFLYLFAGIIFAIVFTIFFGILWLFLPSSVSGAIYSIYPTALAIVSLAYVFAVIYDYFIMFASPTTLFFNSKECNLNGFVGFKEDPPCPSTQNPMSVITTVLKPATDIVVPIFNYIYGTMKSIGGFIYGMTPMGRAEMMTKMAMGAAGAAASKAGLPGIPAGLPGMPPGMPGMPPGMPGMPPGMAGFAALAKQKGGGTIDPLDYLGAGVIGAVLLGGFILGVGRNVSRREYWLNDTPPNPRGV